MKENEKPAEASATAYRVVRLFEGERTAEQVAADLMKVHTPS